MTHALVALESVEHIGVELLLNDGSLFELLEPRMLEGIHTADSLLLVDD